uniref:DUF5131 family protein n=1 Tax=viral metagenome TaxID=1070528 RepID=A0A6M3LBU7_9ZZZZ
MNRIDKTIGWADWSWNPIKGMCKNDCSYCYAKRIYKRFKLNSEVRFDEKELLRPYKLKKPSKIFVCSTHEIFGKWIPNEWIFKILKVAEDNPRHTFLFLTKKPNRYSSFDYPKNCWLGVTYTDFSERWKIATILKYYHSNITFISLEPLLTNKCFTDYLFLSHWLIIGGLTPKPIHKTKWIDIIVIQAKKLNIPIYVKDNAKYDKTIKESPIIESEE